MAGSTDRTSHVTIHKTSDIKYLGFFLNLARHVLRSSFQAPSARSSPGDSVDERLSVKFVNSLFPGIS
jgi:hypothetical protein